MNDVVLVQVVDSFKNLSNCLGCILFGEFALLAYAIKQLTARGEFSHNVIFVLRKRVRFICSLPSELSYLGFEPLMELHDMWMMHSL